MMNLQPEEQEVFPRIRDLPEDQREPFEKWLEGQTRPMVETDDVHDRYYPWDYAQWIDGWSRGLEVPIDD